MQKSYCHRYILDPSVRLWLRRGNVASLASQQGNVFICLFETPRAYGKKIKCTLILALCTSGIAGIHDMTRLNTREYLKGVTGRGNGRENFKYRQITFF